MAPQGGLHQGGRPLGPHDPAENGVDPPPRRRRRPGRRRRPAAEGFAEDDKVKVTVFSFDDDGFRYADREVTATL
ncbi:hypothetical protein ACIQCG_17325 [Streptomyces noursei]|uniref:hypothetical protein n=1 Tax=Streptomyces noursei TaxID=1971 RepID=UPI0038214CB2